MKTRYRGWVPTVTGRLSFSHFGDLEGVRSVRRSDKRKRYLVAHAKRRTGDSLFGVLTDWFSNVQGYSWFVCVAETVDGPGNELDEQAVLKGTIFIISTPERWENHVVPAVESAFISLADFDPNSNGDLEEHFSSTRTALRDQCAAQCAFQTSFELNRNGVVDFIVDDAMRLSPDSPSLGSANDLTTKFGLAHQAYSYLKDLGHHHKHYSPRNDTITDLHEMTDEDDRKWRRRTLYGIYRRIITCMRREEVGQQISSVGLLAYAKSFRAIWLETYPLDDKVEDRKIPIFHDTEMKESIQASELRMRYELQQRTEQDGRFRTLVFGFLGLILSVVGIIDVSKTQIDVPPSSALMFASRQLLAHPLFTILPLAVVIYFFSVVYPRYLQPQYWRMFRVLIVLTQPLTRKFSVAVFWVIAGLLMGLALSLIFGGHLRP